VRGLQIRIRVSVYAVPRQIAALAPHVAVKAVAGDGGAGGEST